MRRSGRTFCLMIGILGLATTGTGCSDDAGGTLFRSSTSSGGTPSANGSPSGSGGSANPDTTTPVPCAATLDVCGDGCVDTDSDSEHCGRCDNPCEDGVCSLGQCTTACAEGQTACGADCVDRQTSAAHCGSCGAACAAGESCEEGICVGGLPAVSFIMPAANTEFGEGETISIEVDASDDDGIENVRLFVNDMFVRQENMSPYEWSSSQEALLRLPVGEHLLRADALDGAGSTGTATISIRVVSGSGGTGGAGTGGSGAGTGGSGTGGGGLDGCRTTLTGATGSEPNGIIPVCCTPSATEKAAINEVFRLLNEHRQANGVGALSYDPLLEEAIQGHCLHMALHTFFAHAAPEPSVEEFGTRAQLCGTRATGENLAAGQRDAASVMETWKNSSGHNRNMINGDYTRVGICNSGRNWGQIFGR